jgi:hypothetical protein
VAHPVNDATLFDAAPYAVAQPGPLSGQRRRTLRQEQAVANGVHPLALVLRDPTIRVHPDAPRDRGGAGPTCGTCWYRRQITTNGSRNWPKCTYGVENRTDQTRGRAPRVTHGAGTDVPRWWPACDSYSPGGGLSPDAARWSPPATARTSKGGGDELVAAGWRPTFQVGGSDAPG